MSTNTKTPEPKFLFHLFQIFTYPRKLCAIFMSQVPNSWKQNMQYYSFELSLNNFGKRYFNCLEYLKEPVSE
jgi:hypothetical protein